MHSTIVRAAVLTLAVALAGPRGLAAQDGETPRNHLYDTWQGSVAFTTVLNRSSARVDASNSDLGTTLNFRSLLGVSGTTVQPAFLARWKPGRHTEFDIGYQFLNQSGQRSFNDSLVIGEDTLSGALDLATKLSSDNLTFQFKYALWARERHTIGLALGLGAIFFGADFDGNASGTCAGPDCSTGGSGDFSISKSFTGPTASLGAFGNFRLGDRWYIAADARGIGAKVDRFDFSVFEGNLGGQYWLSNRWGLGLGYYYTDVSVDVAAKAGTPVSDFIGKISYSYSSARFGVTAAF
jgi:hypothetical protein